ncbi:MAG TPA: FxLYD domain-containing protein, partial [Herpetosiphonaceae bacterium]|nr:FxLYD domain-containing protein [Herpetosiphonaceae bacterium]
MHKQRTILFALIGMLAAILAGCGSGAAPTTGAPATGTPKPTEVAAAPTTRPTATPRPAATAAPTEPPATAAPETAEELAITEMYDYTDESNYFHIVGLVANNTAKPVSSIELTVKIKDGQGETLLTDSDSQPAESLTFSPLIDTVAPGAATPFDYYLYVESEEKKPDTYEVALTGKLTGDEHKGEVAVENARLVDGDDGRLYLTGEVVNQSDEYIQINSFAGAALDAKERIIAAQSPVDMVYLLAPKGETNGYDRAPFRVNMDAPPEEAVGWQTYIDVDSAFSEPDDIRIEFDVPASYYVDQYDRGHLVGSVKNRGTENVDLYLLAGLYDKDGTVIDTDSINVPFWALEPDQSIPFEFSYFGLDSEKTRGELDRYTIQASLSSSHASYYTPVALETSDDKPPTEAGGEFTGTVVNTSDKDLTMIRVVVAFYDAEEKLVATSHTSISPADGSEVIAPGESPEYSIYIDL